VKYPVSFFVIILITFYTNLSKADNLIVYINMDKVMNETIAGVYINNKLEKEHKANIEQFKKIEDELNKQETAIITQKNILSKEEYAEKIALLRTRVNDYKKSRKEKINLLSKNRVDAANKLLEAINPILSNYSKEKGISIILQRKNIVLGKTDLDITDAIIEIANSEIKDFNLN